MSVNATTKKAIVPIFIAAAVLGTAMALPIFGLQHVTAASDGDKNDNVAKASTSEATHVLRGPIASIQLGANGQPEWIQSGIWVMRIFSSNPQNPNVQLIARFEMVKPDGTSAHQHGISDFKVANMTQEGNSTRVLKGTATVTMKNTPVTGVPVTVKVFNNAVIGIWIGPDKVDSHFGTGPIFGTFSATSSKAAAAAITANSTATANTTTATTTNTTQTGNGTSGNSVTAPGQQNATATTSTSASSIKMTAKEVDETYKWSTSDGATNPTLKMTANADNSVQIANPTDAKHELVIESNGKEVASSGDIAANGSGQLSFKPTAAGTYEYHCEYHPTTMKGTIEVSAH